MYLLSAIAIGIVGSLHCVGMCGPLILALHQNHGNTKREIVHHLGRLSVYVGIGIAAGALGSTFSFMGLQQTFSLIAGIVLIAGSLIVFMRHFLGKLEGVISRASIKLASYANRTKAGPSRDFLLGIANGLLPCGVVYLAMVGAANTFTPWDGALYMLAFGMGTLPSLFILTAFGRKIPLQLRSRFKALMPFVVILVGVLLIVRGMDLGIPYLSPENDLLNPSTNCGP